MLYFRALARRGGQSSSHEIGPWQELVAYLRLALRVADDTPEGGGILPPAEEARARLVRLLGIADRLAPNPQVAAVRQRWSRPLREIEDLK